MYCSSLNDFRPQYLSTLSEYTIVCSPAKDRGSNCWPRGFRWLAYGFRWLAQGFTWLAIVNEEGATYIP